MAKRNNKKKIGAKPPQNIDTRGNAFPIIVAIGLLLALLTTGLAFTYLAAAQAPQQERALAERIAQTHAASAAQSINRFLEQLRERVASATTSILAGPSLAGADSSELRQAEHTALSYFPEAVSLRILPLGELGTAVLANTDWGLRNHIEVDLVRRAAEGKPSTAEAYSHEGRWLTSMAQRVDDADAEGHWGAILLTIDNTRLQEQLRPPKSAGKAVLQQLYTDQRGNTLSQDIASAGAAGQHGAEFTALANLADGRWRVAFSPSDELLDSLAVDRGALYAAAGLSMAGAFAGVLLTALLYRQRVRRETAQLLSAAPLRSRLTLDLPELAAIGRQLRRATHAGPAATVPEADDTSDSEITEAPEAEDTPDTNVDQEPSSLLYQSSDIIDRATPSDTQVLELDLELEQEESGEPEGFPEHIFRAYDIRGNAEADLDDDLVYRIGRAVGEMAAERGESSVIVGGDGRLSTPRIRSQLISALLDGGLDVIDIGLVPTPLLYFATHHLDCQAGIMVTGSHNPRDDNGLKIVLDRQTMAAGDIQDIRRRMAAASGDEAGYTRGRVITQDIVPAYIDEVAGDIAIAVPLKIVIDAGNGATSEIAPRLFTELGCEVIPLYCDIDGHFPNHPPDTSDERNLDELCAAVQAESADFGVAFDGDGDRVAVVTGSGKIVRADLLMMLFAQDVVSRNPGADVVFDVKCTRHLARLITQNGGRPVLWKTGHALMKQKIAETGALLGGEFSGHIFFGERWYGHDDGMYAAGRLAEILSTHDQSLDAALEDFPRTVNTPEILVPVEERKKFALMQKIAREADFGAGKVNNLDGIRVDFITGWGLLRASNTSAALTARFEADTQENLEAIMRAFREQVGRVEPELQLTF